MVTPAVFGISNSGVNLAIDLIILFLVVIWLALVYWTYADARRRIADPMLIGCATAASLFPFVGTLVYMIVRPPEYLDDVRERELEIQAAEARLAELGYQLCPHCEYEVEKDFLRCPNCMRKLRDPCPSCGKPLDPTWKMCPFCEADLGAPAPAPRRTRRRRDPLLDRSGATGSSYSESGAPANAADGGTPPPAYAPGQGERGARSGERGARSGDYAPAPSERGSRPGAYAPAQGEPRSMPAYAPSQSDGGTTPATYAPSRRERGRASE
jgi:hypothetical protein